MSSGTAFDRKRRRINKKVVFWLVGIMLVALFTGLVYVLRNWHGSVEMQEKSPASASQVTPIDPSELMEREGMVIPMSQQDRRILNRHFAAVGGINLFISMSSFRIGGDLTLPNGDVHEAVYIKKGANLDRLTLRGREHLQVSAVTPEDQWLAYWRSGELLSVEDLEQAGLVEMRRNSPVVNELYMALQSGWIMQYLGQRDFNYKMSHVFEVQFGQRHSIRFFIDPETFLNVGREDRVFEPDGTLVITRRLYSEHMDANGMTIPGKVETIINDAESRTFSILQAELNVGVLDSVFSRPVMPVKP